MSIDAKTVGELRKRTGLPMMRCKKALQEAGGDLEVAADNLRKQGVKASEKVAARELKEGLVFVHREGNGVCAVSLMCQTDFVAKSEDVVAFGKQLAAELYTRAPADTGTGDQLDDFEINGTTVKKTYDDFALKMGENIKVGDWARFVPETGAVAVYEHHNGRIAAMVEFEGQGLGDSDAVMELGKQLGMQLSFHKDVKALTRDELDEAWVAKEREIFVAQSENMPEDKRAMIAEGKLNKRLKDVVLLEMPFIMNDKVSVQDQLASVAKDAGKELSLKRFARIGAGA